MELAAGKGRRTGVEILAGYITVGSIFGLYWMATVVVCVEMIAITKDLGGLRNK
jgi:predicted branched-subunit amino acid permease